MNLKYSEVFLALKNAVTMTNPPQYQINPSLVSENETLKNIIDSDYDKWKEHVHGDIGNADFRCVGHCEIGNLTGTEIMRMFYDIFKQNQFKIGNYIYFSRNSEVFGAVLFKKYIPRILVLPSSSNSDEKHFYNKLFNE